MRAYHEVRVRRQKLAQRVAGAAKEELEPFEVHKARRDGVKYDGSQAGGVGPPVLLGRREDFEVRDGRGERFEGPQGPQEEGTLGFHCVAVVEPVHGILDMVVQSVEVEPEAFEGRRTRRRGVRLGACLAVRPVLTGRSAEERTTTAFQMTSTALSSMLKSESDRRCEKSEGRNQPLVMLRTSARCRTSRLAGSVPSARSSMMWVLMSSSTRFSSDSRWRTSTGPTSLVNRRREGRRGRTRHTGAM